jgi:pyruvate/2-oxoglutarate/acetoin dehydrogenase E1 component
MARSSTAASKPANTANVPLPYSPPLEDYVLPQTSDIVMALRKLAAY